MILTQVKWCFLNKIEKYYEEEDKYGGTNTIVSAA